jgi:hypothetical protein
MTYLEEVKRSISEEILLKFYVSDIDLYSNHIREINELKNKCLQKLSPNDQKIQSLSQIDKKRLSLTLQMFSYTYENRTLFHVTTTYKKFEDRVYKEKDVNIFFTNFYLKKLVPYLTQTKNYNRDRHRHKQPICFSFIDEHRMNNVRTVLFDHRTHQMKETYDTPVRLHHHSIIAVHNDNVDRMKRLIGENTVSNSHFSPIMLTSDIKQCDPIVLLYSSKKLREYPDFQSFPDRLKSSLIDKQKI